MDIAADIVSVSAAELVLRLDLVGGAVEEHYQAADVPYVCPDIPPEPAALRVAAAAFSPNRLSGLSNEPATIAARICGAGGMRASPATKKSRNAGSTSLSDW